MEKNGKALLLTDVYGSESVDEHNEKLFILFIIYLFILFIIYLFNYFIF